MESLSSVLTVMKRRIRLFVCLFLCLCHIELSEAQFRKQPKDVYADLGGTVTLPCAIRRVRYGKGEVSWNYKLAGVAGQQNISSEYLLYPSLDTDRRRRYSILGNRSNGEYNLQITNVRNSDEATYECVYYEGHADPALITNRKRGGILAIGRYPDPGYPLCSMSPSTGVLPLMNVTFTCTTRGGNPMGKVRWYTGTKWIGKWGLDGTIQHTRFLTANDVGLVLSCQEDHPSRPRYPRMCQVNPLTALGISITPGPQVSVLTGNNMIFSCVPNKKGNYGYLWTINGHIFVRSPYIFPLEILEKNCV
ncbi:kin of IRRE-like protein 1 [Amphiura filiformis]|uniref:kin of IRRE-like protein 1 n=1 Tax=Amphiura filiformis TaxID=82378 RepID=UPI003B214FCD